MQKKYVDVIVQYTRDGTMIPLEVIWEDGRKYQVDKVMDVRQAPSLKAGGQGMRYKCRILSKETYIWLEDGKWFVEAK